MPARFEIALQGRIIETITPLVERRGHKTWQVDVPANGEATLDVAIAD
jgi:hypothetical protein